MKKNKKAILSSTVILILVVFTALILLSLLLFFKSSTVNTIDRLKCYTTIEAHVNFVKAEYFAQDKIDENTGLLALALPEIKSAKAPEIECALKGFTKSNAATAEEASYEIMELMVDTWHKFDEGKAMIYPQYDDKNICVPIEVIKFKKDYKIDLKMAFVKTRVSEILNFYEKDESVFDYFNNTIEDLAFKTTINYIGDFSWDEMLVKIIRNDKIIQPNGLHNELKTFIPKKELLESTDEPIAIIFQQHHKYGIIGIESSVLAIPYNKENMDAIGCEIYPATKTT